MDIIHISAHYRTTKLCLYFFFHDLFPVCVIRFPLFRLGTNQAQIKCKARKLQSSGQDKINYNSFEIYILMEIKLQFRQALRAIAYFHAQTANSNKVVSKLWLYCATRMSGLVLDIYAKYFIMCISVALQNSLCGCGEPYQGENLYSLQTYYSWSFFK